MIKKCKFCSKITPRPLFTGTTYCNEKCRYNNTLTKIRITLFDRDECTCKYCGRSPMKDKNVILHIDHKIPKKKGGTDDLNNLITSCEQCNLGKSDLLLNYWKSKNENS